MKASRWPWTLGLASLLGAAACSSSSKDTAATGPLPAGCIPADGTYLVHYEQVGDGGPTCSVPPDMTVTLPSTFDAGVASPSGAASCTSSTRGCTFEVSCTADDDAGVGVTLSSTTTYGPSSISGTETITTAFAGSSTTCELSFTWTRQ